MTGSNSEELDELLDNFAEEANSLADDFEHNTARVLENYQFAKKHAKTQIQALLDKQVNEARLDELERHIEQERGVAGSIHMSRIDVENRLEALKTNQRRDES